MILDLRADPAEHNLPQPARDAICAHHEALAGWLQQAVSWVRSGEGAGEVLGGLPEPPVLSGPGDHLAALATWYGLLRRTSAVFSTKSVPSRPGNHAVPWGCITCLWLQASAHCPGRMRAARRLQ
jgi:hypothetical protein